MEGIEAIDAIEGELCASYEVAGVAIGSLDLVELGRKG